MNLQLKSDSENIEALLQAAVIVVANAGTVNSTSFDDFPTISELKRKYDFWLHVDAPV